MVAPEDSEDVLNDALVLLGGEQSTDADNIWYGEFELSVAAKEGRANTLLADQLFSPALFFAERIELGEIDVIDHTVLELGAGAGLPSILAAHPSIGRARVVIASDYPDPVILNNLRASVARNDSTAVVLGFEWGTDPTSVLQQLICQGLPGDGFDILFLSDLLHFDASHDVLLDSACTLLLRSVDARIYVCCGDYTREPVCASFVANAATRGIVLEEQPRERTWRAKRYLKGLSREDMIARKTQCRFWVGRWDDTHVRST